MFRDRLNIPLRVVDTTASSGIDADLPEQRMAQTPEQLVVRQHERYLCRLPAKVRVGEGYTDQVSLTRTVGDGAGGVEVWVVDCSRGGLGIETPVLFPRGCRLKVTFLGGTTPVELSVRVQRVTMQDRKPTYYIGLSFVGSGDVHAANVESALAMARAGAGQKGAA